MRTIIGISLVCGVMFVGMVLGMVAIMMGVPMILGVLITGLVIGVITGSISVRFSRKSYNTSKE